MMTVMQNFLSREKKTQHIIKVSKLHLQESVRGHARAVDDLTEDLDEDSLSTLKSENAKLVASVEKTMDFATQEIVGEREDAEERLKAITKDLVNELRSNVAHEKEDFQAMENEDPEAYAEFQKEHHESPEEKLKNTELAKEETEFMHMIQEFYATVNAMGDFDISPKRMKAAKQLLTNVRRGEVDYKTGLSQMKSMMDKNNVRYKKSGNIVDQFQQWLQAAKFAPEKQSMKDKLTEWQNGKLSDSEMLLYMEEKAASGAVALEWFVTKTN